MRNWQLLAAGLWLVVAGLLAFRADLLSPEQAERMQGANWRTAASIAAFLSVWNLARWYQAKARQAADRALRQPIRIRRGEPQGYEYNPEFDFQNQERPQMNAESSTDQNKRD